MVGAINVAVNLLMALGVAGGTGMWIDRTGRRSRTRRVIAVAVGVALGALSWWGIATVDKLETTVQTLVKDVGELKGAVNVIQRGLRMEVAGPAE